MSRLVSTTWSRSETPTTSWFSSTSTLSREPARKMTETVPSRFTSVSKGT